MAVFGCQGRECDEKNRKGFFDTKNVTASRGRGLLE
jgi:hypothetical protein